MADGISIDLSEVHKLVADFGRASAKSLPLVEKVVEHAALNIKNDLVGQAIYSRHFRGMAGSITYDRAYGLGSVGFEVGPDKQKRGGALGNLFFFGGVHGGGGTGDLDGAVRTEQPRMIKALEDLTGGLLG